ncbi:Peptidoglycan D,D-transpeptidase MrdA [subsurface metagenome]
MSLELSSGLRKPSFVKRRAIFLFISIILSFVFLSGNLFILQVVKGLEYKRRAQAVARRQMPIPAQRGEIYDRRYDIPLVVNRDSFAVDMIPGEVGDNERQELFRKLSILLNITVEQIKKRVPPRYYHLYQPIEIKSGIDFETIAYLGEHIEEFTGVTWHNKPVRSYLEGGTLAHVIGYVGDISREEIQVLYNRGYSFGTVLGKNGIEKQYDEVLRGKDGTRFRLVDVQERSLKKKSSEDIPPVPGNNLVLTIDRNIQHLCEQALGERIGSVVVLKPASGEVLALVSYPTYDPNMFFTDKAAAEYKRLSLDPASPFLNRAIQSSYPPASAFKMIMSTAVAEEEAFSLNQTVNCTGKIEYGDRIFHCHLRKIGHGPMDLFSGLAQSCDVYFYTVGDAFGVERITYYARDFGLDAISGIDLPGETGGFVPTPEWKEKVHHMKWLGGDTINLSIGQGYLLVTPLQMVNIVAMIVNEGKIFRPHLVKEIRDPTSGDIISKVAPELIHTSHIRKSSFRTVQKALRGVITEGTAKVVLTTEAVEIAGKTGTGEVGKEDKWHSWFAAYAPYETDNPEDRVVVVVMVEAENEWEWWAPKAANVIFQAIFAGQSYQEALDTLKPWWYVKWLQEQEE